MSSSAVTTHAFSPASGITHNVRVVTIDGALWFVSADVCRALGMALTSGTAQWTRNLPADEKGMTSIHTLGGPQTLAIVSESGLYRLLMRSDKPNARLFQDWAAKVVFPSIRKDGAYVMGEEKVATGELAEDELILRAMEAMQRKVARYREENAQLTAEVSTLAPKAAVADAHFAVNGPVPVARFFRTLDGVNSNAAKRDLMRLGYLYRTSPGPNGTYCVRSAFRDVLFVEKRHEQFLKVDVFLTAAGQRG